MRRTPSRCLSGSEGFTEGTSPSAVPGADRFQTRGIDAPIDAHARPAVDAGRPVIRVDRPQAALDGAGENARVRERCRVRSIALLSLLYPLDGGRARSGLNRILQVTGSRCPTWHLTAQSRSRRVVKVELATGYTQTEHH